MRPVIHQPAARHSSKTEHTSFIMLSENIHTYKEFEIKLGS